MTWHKPFIVCLAIGAKAEYIFLPPYRRAVAPRIASVKFKLCQLKFVIVWRLFSQPFPYTVACIAAHTNPNR